MQSTKHWHHIIPRHMGGTDDPSNLVELTVEEHAQAHLELYDFKYGKPEDAWAARILGAPPKTDRHTSGMKGKNHSEDTKSRMSASRVGNKNRLGSSVLPKPMPKIQLLRKQFGQNGKDFYETNY